jgi:hypothetical protein
MEVNKMNIELLREIAKVIQLRPEEFDMREFNSTNHSCGTVHCIGGWAAVLSGTATLRETREKLGLSLRQWNRLCYVECEEEFGGGWPSKFWGVEDRWKPTPEQAVARIEHFIATEGRE